MIKIAIIDDHSIFRSGLKNLLESIPECSVSLECSNGKEFLDAIENTKVDIALLDLDMPVLNGLETIEALKQLNTDIKTIILSSSKDANMIASLMEIGANGYLLKDTSGEELRIALFSVQQTGFYFNDLVSKAMLSKLSYKKDIAPTFNYGESLSDREMEVLCLICDELTTSEIADQLFISPKTVESHRAKIMQKTGARNAAGIVMFAIKNKLIDVD